MRDISRHAPLTVWSPTGEDAAPILQVLAEGYNLDIRDSLPDQAPAEGTLLLLHLAPAIAICRAMAAGTGPEAALRDWQAQTRAILALNRRNRRGSRVLSITAALDHPAAFRDRFGLPAGSGPGGARRNDQDNLFLLTLAQQMLHNDPQNRLLMAELDAVSIGLSDSAPTDPVDPEAVFQAYQGSQSALEEAQRLQRENLDLRGETERLSTRNSALETADHDRTAALEEAQTEIGLLQLQGQELQDELKILLERNAEIAGQLQAQEAETAASRQQVADLEQHNGALQEQLEALGRQTAGLEAQLAESDAAQRTSGSVISLLQTQGRELQEELEALARRNVQLTEASAKLPALERELTRTRDTLKGRLSGKEDSLRAADELIRQMKAQQTALRAELALMTARAADSQGENTVKQARIAGLEDELRTLREALGRAEAELHHVYNSRSYRVTGPLRRIRALLSGQRPA